MSERELQDAVIDCAQRLGWRCAHFRPARTKDGWRTAVSADGKGFPDLVMFRGGRQIAAELKREDGKLTLEQLEWLIAFETAGAEIRVWFPHDLSSGEIERVLRGEEPT